MTDRELAARNWIYLKLQPYRQTSIAVRRNLKLSARFYGPYKVLQRIGPVTYRLEIPTGSQIHHVFHVSQLKKRVGPQIEVQTQPTACDSDGAVLVQPIAILQRPIEKVNNVAKVRVLVQWENLGP
ncbi:uncharacterized protein LOC142171960 [Nicotiana tabacum]|uniref:Uncharacterized protein LOC142171960 n=1 Tax=Nicotiana tabacum TaxID=4097 RepID=A0AC58T3J7_TOBAC